MNFKEIKELIEILDKSTLTEINIEDTKGKVTLKKEKETEIITPQISQMPVEAAAMPMPQVQSTDSNKTEAPKPTSDNHKTINAPMVGTFTNRLLQTKKHMCKLGTLFQMKQQCVF